MEVLYFLPHFDKLGGVISKFWYIEGYIATTLINQGGKMYFSHNFFIIIRIKNSLKYKFFSLFYTNSFYFISHYHFLLILKLTTPLLYYVSVFAKQDQ
jgi:hypothetical protein